MKRHYILRVRIRVLGLAKLTGVFCIQQTGTGTGIRESLSWARVWGSRKEMSLRNSF